jgi:CheY-like chemotaxis protein
MHAMQGSIGVETTVGKGSTFWIELAATECPLQRIAAQKNNIPTQQKKLACDQKRKVLYIEDNVSNLNLMEQMLEEKPEIELMTAIQGKIGLDLARQHSPDLILLDLHLPDLPGWDVLSQLQASETTKNIPAIVVSADATKRQIDRLMAAGAHGYLTKPLNIEEFFQVLEKTQKKTSPTKQEVAA